MFSLSSCQFRETVTAPTRNQGAILFQGFQAPEDAEGPDYSGVPIGAVDKAVAAMATLSPMFIHVVVDLGGELDLARLNDEWEKMGQAIPTLRAIGDPFARSAAWGARADVEPLVVVSEDAGHVSPSPGPQELALLSTCPNLAVHGPTRLAVIKRNQPGGVGETHRLIWSINHVLVDGWSASALVAELAIRYSDRQPQERLSSNSALRPVRLEDAVAARLDRTTRLLVANQYARKWVAPKRSAHVVANSVSATPGYATIDVTEAVEALGPHRLRFGWRATAVLLALLARAWGSVFGSPPSGSAIDGWQAASNLRPQLGLQGGLGNLSGTEPLQLFGVSSKPLFSVIDDAHRALSALASGWPGLGAGLAAIDSAMLPEELFSSAVLTSFKRSATLGYGRSLSNLGAWPTQIARWGDAQATSCVLVPPMSDPRWSTFLVLGLAGRVQIALLTHDVGVSATDAEALGAHIIADARASTR